jgi:hypothetical protein
MSNKRKKCIAQKSTLWYIQLDFPEAYFFQKY